MELTDTLKTIVSDAGAQVIQVLTTAVLSAFTAIIGIIVGKNISKKGR